MTTDMNTYEDTTKTYEDITRAQAARWQNPWRNARTGAPTPNHPVQRLQAARKRFQDATMFEVPGSLTYALAEAAKESEYINVIASLVGRIEQLEAQLVTNHVIDTDQTIAADGGLL